MRSLCGILNVSPKCYYAFLKGPREKDVRDDELMKLIKDRQESHGFNLGYRQMATQLSEDLGVKLNRKRIELLMRKSDSLSRVRRKKYSEEVYATRRAVKAMVIPDLLSRDFHSIAPRRRFVQDITYLPSLQGTWYLNTIEDLFNGEIVARKYSEHVDAQLCVDTVSLLIEALEGKTEGIILHTDAGTTYTSYVYRQNLKDHGIIQSMGEKASCYDNARMESLNGIIKTEAFYCRFGITRFKDKRIPLKDILSLADWYVDYYNNRRYKDSLGKRTPVEFRLVNPHGTYPALPRCTALAATKNLDIS